MRTMQALVKGERAPGLWLQEIPMPPVGEFDVLVRILRSSICGTDLHIYNWDAWAQRTVPVPMQIGHEFVGIIDSVGSHVIDFHPGMIVTGEGHIVCGRCRNCLAGRRHLCNKTNGVGVNRPGAFAQYLAMPQTNVWVADPKIPLDVLSCFDPLGNAVHTALSFDVLGEDVLITGAGPIGIMAAAIVRHAGARFVVITDVNPYRLKLAESMGVTRAVDFTKVSLKEVMDELGMKEGFDVGLEVSGNGDALNGMLATMCHGGKIAVLGIQSKNAAIDWDLVVFNGLTIKGIYGREMYETWYKMTTMIQSGLDISPVITHRLPYQDFDQAFQLVKNGQAGKIVLYWNDAGVPSAK
jgi:threonine 3-dehydrogenase